MAKKFKFSTSGLLNFAEGSYLERTSRPVYALVFLLPFVVFYEVGTILINTDVLNESQVRVVAFVWLQDLLEQIGLGGKFAWVAPALVVMVILVALQLVSGKKWGVWVWDFAVMLMECIVLAIPLIVLSLILQSNSAGQGGSGGTVTGVAGWFARLASSAGQAEAGRGAGRFMADIVTGIGAGIYEELIFRLILICVFMVIFQDVLGVSRRNSVVISVLFSAALFSAHHHIDFMSGRFNHQDVFDWTKFLFRTIAGVYFAIVFAIRGFGITAGSHAFYDIIATCLNALVFSR